MKQKGFAQVLILVGIVLIIGIAGGAYYFGKFSSKPAQQPVAQQVATPTSQSAQDETANWKTYSDDQDIYFKYPQEGTVVKDLKLVILQYREPNAPDGVELPAGYMITC